MTKSASVAGWLFCDNYCTPWRSQHRLLVSFSVTTTVHHDTVSIDCWLAFLWQLLYTLTQSASVASWLLHDNCCTLWCSEHPLLVGFSVTSTVHHDAVSIDCWLAFLWQLLYTMMQSASIAGWLFCDNYCTPWRSQHWLLVGFSVTIVYHDAVSIDCWLAFLWQLLYTMTQSASDAGWLFCDNYCTPWRSQLRMLVGFSVTTTVHHDAFSIRCWLAFL